MSFSKATTLDELRRDVAQAVADGSAELVVPFFGGSTQAFDQIVSEGLATGYVTLMALKLVRRGDRS